MKPDGIKQTLVIQGELTDLNTYVRIERSNKYAAAQIKEDETYRVANECVVSKLRKMQKIKHMTIYWFAKDERKDTDNIEFAKKFIMDGLVACGILPGDGRKFTGATTHYHYVDKEKPRVEVILKGI